MSTGDTTLPADPAARIAARPERCYAVVVCQCIAEPERCGEAALLDPSSGADEWIIGRDSGVAFVLQRPGELLDCGPLGGKLLSREQLRFGFAGDALRVENTGSQRAFVDGTELPRGSSVVIDVGTVIEVDGHSTFVVELRPPAIPVARRALLPLPPFGEPCAMGFAAESPAAWEHRDEIVLVASDAKAKAAVIFGETGTGKDVTARAIHALSPRAKKPFQPVNCAEITPELAAARFFGTRKDWPTPGTPQTDGYFGEAGDGDLFLDEIACLETRTHAVLLRAMESGCQRVGETTTRPTRCRILAATNKPPSSVAEDVLMRFGHVIVCKPLRERPSDIAHVARAALLRQVEGDAELEGKFLRKDARGRPYVVCDQSLMATLLRHPLTGNARQVGNIVTAAVKEARGTGVIRWPASVPAPAARQLEPAGTSAAAASAAQAAQVAPGMRTREQVLAALERNHWRYAPTAMDLGVSEDQLYRLRKKYGLDDR
jgi:DNA-binding NtrC family response regulator